MNAICIYLEFVFLFAMDGVVNISAFNDVAFVLAGLEMLLAWPDFIAHANQGEFTCVIPSFQLSHSG